MIVCIPSSCSQEAVDFLKDRGYEVRVGTGTSPEDLLAMAPYADAVMARIERYPAGFVAAASHLRILARHGVGVDNLPVREAEEAGIWVSNTPYANCDAVAEATIGSLLCVSLGLRASDEAMHRGEFAYRGALHGELRGKTLAVLGYGRIGQRVSLMAHDGLGMQVVVWDHRPETKTFPAWCRVAASWQDAVRGADAVTLHVALTPETRNLFDRKAFALLKPGALFLNLARGGLIDEDALCDALESGRLGGAALDCYAQEPLPLSSRLLQAPNLLLTPHNASHTKEAMARMALGAAWCIDDVLSGKAPRWAVNHPRQTKRG